MSSLISFATSYNDTRRGEAGRGEARRGGAGRAAVRCGAVRATTNEGSTEPILTEDWPFIPVTQSPRICHVTQQFVAAFWAAPWPISGSLSWQPSVNILSRDSRASCVSSPSGKKGRSATITDTQRSTSSMYASTGMTTWGARCMDRHGKAGITGGYSKHAGRGEGHV